MPDSRTSKLRDHLEALNAEYAQATNGGGPVPATGVVDNLVARYGIYGYRQVEAIIALSKTNDLMHLQVAQMVRSLVEAWSYAAWIVAPESEEQRTRRAIGLVTKSIRAHREKVTYQDEHWPGTDPAHLALLQQREQEVEEQADQNGREFPPDLRQGMEGLGRADRYITYRWNSDAVHVSTTGLGQLVLSTDEGTLLGVGGDPDQQLARLITAWMSAADLYEIVTAQFGFAIPDWDTKREEVEGIFTHLYEEEE